MGKNSDESDMNNLKTSKIKMVGSYMKRTDHHLESEIKDLSKELKHKLGRIDGEAGQVRLKANQLVDEQENAASSRRSSLEDSKSLTPKRSSVSGSEGLLVPQSKNSNRRASMTTVSTPNSNTNTPRSPAKRNSIVDISSGNRRQSVPAIHLARSREQLKKSQDSSKSAANHSSRRVSISSSLNEEEEEEIIGPNSLDYLKECRYLRIPGHVERELSIDEVFGDN
ncbi:unnamed protein product [Dimorphilus gyrociliatus]|uniref:Uncharacterized protein n=1 Tax=Dimorphilus gyrociliatus TaxID=2664684 RepID=A0A7I8VJ62_9ANNE|nr:unnamed protein product [Dimorphilus gyrociliatus]